MSTDSFYTDVITSGSSEDTITIDSTSIDNTTLNSIINSTMASNLNYSITNSGTSGTAGIGAGTYYYTNTTAPWITTAQTSPRTLDVKGDANFEGDIKFKGRSLEELFSKIEDRLAILQPDPAKLEKYEALRKAYEHYKLMEKLIVEE